MRDPPPRCTARVVPCRLQSPRARRSAGLPRRQSRGTRRPVPVQACQGRKRRQNQVPVRAAPRHVIFDRPALRRPRLQSRRAIGRCWTGPCAAWPRLRTPWVRRQPLPWYRRSADRLPRPRLPSTPQSGCRTLYSQQTPAGCHWSSGPHTRVKTGGPWRPVQPLRPQTGRRPLQAGHTGAMPALRAADSLQLVPNCCKRPRQMNPSRVYKAGHT